VSVNLDRPYLLLLRDDTSGAILFVARVGDPSTT
jgi:serine protease inhibitor